MATIIEVKYFNSFLLKKINSGNDPIWNGSYGIPQTSPTSTINGGYPQVTGASATNDYVFEESRIRGGFNNTSVDYGAKAYLVEEEPAGYRRFNAFIYSGIFNSRTGINNTNVFNVAEDITKAADPANGSIQKLYAEDTNLVILQENKISRALIDKDAIYSAEGQGSAVSTANLVIGQIVPYAGNFGISKNPESFAVYGFRKYFVDKNRNAILRLSQDGITEISNYGMYDYFRDELSSLSASDKAIGAWDIHTKQYVVSLQGSNITATTSGPDNLISDTYQTLSFDESVLGWTSRYTYKPDQAFSVKSKYYTIIDGKLYEHNFQPFLQDDNRGNFYGVYSDSTVTFIFNPKVSASKVFKTVNYEGSTGWEVSQFNAARSFELNDTSNLVYSYDEGAYTQDGIQYYAGFYKKEGKYFANLVNNNNLGSPGEVVYGQSISGVKGYYATVTIRTDNSTRVPGLGGKTRELFAVSSEYVESSY